MTKKTQERLRKLHDLFLFIFFITFALQLIGLFILLFITPVRIASAQDAIAPGGVTFTPQVDIPGSEFVKGSPISFNKDNRGLWIAKYIQAWYKFAVAGVGILAVVVIMGGGLIWLTAGGQADKISTAKDWITGAVVGLILALMSYTLLDILNPSLVTFQSLEIPEIEFVDSGLCCFPSNGPKPSVASGGCVLKDEKGGEETGERCKLLQSCKLDVVEGKEQYHCVDAKEGDSCGDETACPEGWFCVNSGCYNGSVGDPCDIDKTSCATGYYCSREIIGYYPNLSPRFGQAICYDGIKGEICNKDKTGECNEPMVCKGGTCQYPEGCIPKDQPCTWGLDYECCNNGSGRDCDCIAGLINCKCK